MLSSSKRVCSPLFERYTPYKFHAYFLRIISLLTILLTFSIITAVSLVNRTFNFLPSTLAFVHHNAGISCI